MTQVRFESSGGQLDPDVTAAVQRVGDSLAADGVQVDYSAEIVSDISSIFGPAELIGLAVTVVVLLVLLGSVLAAGLPLLTALVGVTVGLGAAMSLSSVVEMTSVTRHWPSCSASRSASTTPCSSSTATACSWPPGWRRATRSRWPTAPPATR
ncbi:MMPL family transporter [Georgenia yuyongxinii]|nr:MMPL family transporter [Georgenia yuyongxinii]